MLGHDDLEWRGTALYFGRRQLITIVPDAKYPNMWRVKYPDGHLSDMVNRTRAADAAVGVALKIANSRHRERPRGAADSAFDADPLSGLGQPAKRAQRGRAT